MHRSDDNSAEIPVGGIQTILEESHSDALLVYDACHSANTAWTKPSLHGGITELITTCGFESKALGVGKASFTNTFTDVLFYASLQQEPLSVSELYGQCLSRLRNAGNRTDQTTPLHCTLTSENTGRHIILQPLARLNKLQGGNTVVEAASIPSENPLLIHTVFFGIRGDFDETSLRTLREWILKVPPEFSEFLLNRIALAGPKFGPCLAQLMKATTQHEQLRQVSGQLLAIQG
jgi:hypothetical protein